jgi:aldose 1-epimerase
MSARTTTAGSSALSPTAVTEANPFGHLPDGRPVHVYRLMSGSGMELRFLSLGGIIASLTVPDRHGRVDDVTPGYDTLDGYLNDPAYFGAIIGRYANRIDHGRFVLDDVEHHVRTNEGKHQLHGGPGGFHSVLWRVELHQGRDASGATLHYHSPSGEEGFPGALDVSVTYSVTRDHAFIVDYRAQSDQATPVNLTQHLYLNLDGHSSGSVLDHELVIDASRFTPVRPDLIPTGELRPVHATAFDFTRGATIGSRIAWADEQLRFGGGYDHNFVLDMPFGVALPRAAHLRGPVSGRVMDLFTTEPGLQFYSGNGMGSLAPGKGGHRYGPSAAIALETQHFPDSPNQPRFPSTILRPGSVFRSRTVYRFSTG